MLELQNEHIPADVRREAKVALPADEDESWLFNCAESFHANHQLWLNKSIVLKTHAGQVLLYRVATGRAG